MSSHSHHPKQSHAVPNAPAHPSDPTTDHLPKRRRGGQELPDSVQDRPEQNAGYDAAVHGGVRAEEDASGDADVELKPEERGSDAEQIPPASPSEKSQLNDIDDRAERDVIREVRRREAAAR